MAKPDKGSSSPPPVCRYPIGAGVCGRAATHRLPVGAASNADALDLCGEHAPRFLGAAAPIPGAAS